MSISDITNLSTRNARENSSWSLSLFIGIAIAILVALVLLGVSFMMWRRHVYAELQALHNAEDGRHLLRASLDAELPAIKTTPPTPWKSEDYDLKEVEKARLLSVRPRRHSLTLVKSTKEAAPAPISPSPQIQTLFLARIPVLQKRPTIGSLAGSEIGHSFNDAHSFVTAHPEEVMEVRDELSKHFVLAPSEQEPRRLLSHQRSASWSGRSRGRLKSSAIGMSTSRRPLPVFDAYL